MENNASGVRPVASFVGVGLNSIDTNVPHFEITL